MGLWGTLLSGWQQGAVSHGLVVANGSGRLERERLALGEGLQRQLE